MFKRGSRLELRRRPRCTLLSVAAGTKSLPGHHTDHSDYVSRSTNVHRGVKLWVVPCWSIENAKPPSTFPGRCTLLGHVVMADDYEVLEEKLILALQ